MSSSVMSSRTAMVAGLSGLVVASLLFAPTAVSSTAWTEARPAGPAEPMGRMSSRIGGDPVAVTSDAACPRTKRKLWIEGEGWVVRRVALCR